MGLKYKILKLLGRAPEEGNGELQSVYRAIDANSVDIDPQTGCIRDRGNNLKRNAAAATVPQLNP